MSSLSIKTKWKTQLTVSSFQSSNKIADEMNWEWLSTPSTTTNYSDLIDLMDLMNPFDLMDPMDPMDPMDSSDPMDCDEINLIEEKMNWTPIPFGSFLSLN